MLGRQCIHIATRDCPSNVKRAWSYRDYYRYKGWSRDKYLKFTHVTCCKPNIEEKAYRSTKRKTAVTKPLPTTYVERHRNCLSNVKRLGKRRRQDDKLQMHGPSLPACRNRGEVARLDLSLLLVCRQIHREAALLPYECNTFAFCNGLDLNLFISKSLLATQRKAIRRLQLNGWLAGYRRFPGLLPSTVKFMSGLSELEVCVPKYCGESIRGPYLFSELPLSKVRVIIENHSKDDSSESRKNAKRIERRLMNWPVQC